MSRSTAAALVQDVEGDAVLDVRDLRVRFSTPRGTVVAVDGVDLQVGAGEALALVGESGSGKSVSMLATMGLLPRTASVSGSVRLAGLELRGCSERQLRSVRGDRIGMVFQDPMSSLNPVHTVGRQVGEVLRLHRGAGRRARRARAVELLDRVGIPDAARRVDAHPHELSGGMRQRAMIAIALAGDPEVLVADEPTTALDVTVQRQVVALVRELQQERDLAVVWITHDLGVVAEVADHVAVMYAGRIVERGTAEEVYGATAHPYTSGLLRSIPRLTGDVGDALPEIPGAPPVTVADRAACAFAPRCPLVEPACAQEAPALLPVASVDGVDEADAAHVAACIRHEQVGTIRWAHAGAADRAAPAGDAEAPLVRIDDVAVHFEVRRGLLGSRRTALRAVDGVTLDVAAGRTLGVVGESGCGKTTLGRTLVGLEAPTAGTVRIGDDVVSTRPGPRRRRVQMVFQDPSSSMNPGMRVGDVVSEPIRVHGLHPPEQVGAVVAGLLADVGLPAHAADRFPHEFSGGQRQRIAVARALAAEPEVVVCDEAVASLDVSVQAQIVNLLLRLQRERGLAFVFIAHDLAVVRHVADEVAVMYLGQVVERADRDALYAQPLHPYTRALLDAVPDPTPGGAAHVVAPLEGDLPSPVDPPAGCRFHTRCPVAEAGRCDVEPPPLRALGGGRSVACHLVEVGADGAPIPPAPPAVAT